jgi:Glycosyltransferase family 87
VIAPRRFTELAAVAAAAVFLLAWGGLHTAWYDDGEIVDIPVYERYGTAIENGAVPYRDIRPEYPPGALPAFVLPALLSDDEEQYRNLFEWLMAACGAALVILTAVALRGLRATRRRTVAVLAVTAAFPLLLGSVVLTRFDLWPAALTVGALAALVAGRERLGLGVLGAAVAAKLYPLVLLPLALLFVARRQGARAAAASFGVFALVLAVALGPFLLVAPGGVVESFERQAERPLQIESLGAAFLLAADRLGEYEASIMTSSGSQNLAGSLPDALASVQTVLQALAVATVWILFARSRRGPVELLTASAAAVAALVAFGKVLSPQFLIWLVPLVPLVLERAGAAAALFGAAAITTLIWFPYRYWEVAAVERPVWFVLVRDVLLVALFAALLRAMTGRRAAARSS